MVIKQNVKNKLLLHICCIDCGAYVLELLQKEYQITLFFYNPNVEPIEEYQKRLVETEKIANKFNFKIIEADYDNTEWHELVRGHEMDPERGERCQICYRARLEKTVQYAKENNFDAFTTTLTISPHKDAFKINEIGSELEQKYGVEFLTRDFKKQDGFKKSCQLSKELDLYRQEYCGCGYSLSRLSRKAR